MLGEKDVNKVLIGKAPPLEAESIRAKLAKNGISIATAHNGAACNSGCKIEFELWAHPDDVAAIQQLLSQEWQMQVTQYGYDPALASHVFDPTAPEATCPACATVFSTAQTECPECGLQFS